MRAKSLGKGLISIVLVLLMITSLVSMSAFAVTFDSDNKVTSTAFKLINYDYGKPVNGCVVSGEIGIVFMEYDKSGIYICTEDTYSNPDDLIPTTDLYFAANKQYYYVLTFSAHDESNGFSSTFTAANATMTINGVLCEQVGAANNRNSYIAIFKLPILEAVPMAIPFTKIVEQGGNVAPGAESFELEVINAENGSDNLIENYTLNGINFTTDGTGAFDKQFTISSDDFGSVLDLLDEGILVREKDLWSPGWQYDETVWLVTLYHPPVVNALDDETPTMSGYRVNFVKGKMVDGEFESESNESAEKMTFTNIYTEDTITVKIPFVKKVTLGGDIAPTEETFNFEIFDIGSGNIDDYTDVTYTADVTVNGKGEFEGEIAITGPNSQVEMYVSEGFFVRELKGNAANWTYSDAVWNVIPEWNEQQELEFVAYSTTKETSDNGDYYVVAEKPAEKMSFENIYTKNKEVKPTQPQSPQTGDNSTMILWLTLLLISGLAITGAIVYFNRKRSVK